MQIKITVFTPTYNRAYTLTKLFASLKIQNYKNFEWLIIDDGSTDNTEMLIKEFQNEDVFFNIVYKKNNHGGKHRAINTGLEIACGALFFLVDSDDYLVKDSLDKIVYWEQQVHNKDKCIGLCGMMADKNGEKLGKQFPEKYMYLTLIELIKQGFHGDRADVLYTDKFRKYKYPTFPKEWHIAPGVPFLRMARDEYKLLFFNEVICVVEYMQDGLTQMGEKKLLDNFNGYTLRCKELLGVDIGINKKIKIIGKYTYLARKKGIDYVYIAHSIKKNIVLCIILGYFAKIGLSISKKL